MFYGEYSNRVRGSGHLGVVLEVLGGEGLAVTIDLGEAGNVHPRNKQPVGQRLAQWALGDVSGSAA